MADSETSFRQENKAVEPNFLFLVFGKEVTFSIVIFWLVLSCTAQSYSTKYILMIFEIYLLTAIGS